MQQNPPYPRPAYAWYCLAIICLAYLFGFMDRIIVGLLTPAIQQDLGLSDSEMGVIQGLAFAVFYTLFGLPIGWAADRLNRKWLLAAGTTLWSLMTAGAGLVRSFGGLFVMRAGVGVGEATLNPCATSLIGDSFEPRSRPKAFGIYTMSTALGAGVAYLGGGLILGFVGVGSGGRSFEMPLLGPIPAWQAVFIIIGVAGLVPALLLALTVREPQRRDLARPGTDTAPAGAGAFIRQNRRTLACHHLGVALIVLAVYGWVNWLPAYFVRLHGWPVAKFSIWYGLLGGLTGIVSAVSSGFVTNWFKRRGHADGAMRTVLVGGVGLTLGTGIAPLLPTPELALAGFVVAGIFNNYAPAQALAAIAEMTPNQLRGFVTAVYVLVIGIAGAGLGPFAMGWVTDHVFGDPQKIHYSMALVTMVSGLTGSALIALGLKPYRASLARVTWH
ncbi:MAG: MFS transporter [Gammaproteobacteria bacterium]|nr:MFS transporter [Gammaproteobacteria bacterium]